MVKTAILVDGGFYLKRAKYFWGTENPKDMATRLVDYCLNHINNDTEEPNKYLYRIFYYDCPPSSEKYTHPLDGSTVDLGASPLFQQKEQFFKELIKKRKVALRMGELSKAGGFVFKPSVIAKLCDGTMSVSTLTKNDFKLDIKQKGVDMKIGLDIASLAQKRLVDQIVLIAGDSDFIPAAKHARREGIDFILDNMLHTIKSDLNKHIDGIRTFCTPRTQTPQPSTQTTV